MSAFVLMTQLLLLLCSAYSGSSECPETAEGSYPDLKTVAVVGGCIAGGTVAVVAAPVVISTIGFTSAGIAAGSFAASMMSSMAPTVAGGIVATLQSVGAAGMGVAGTTAAATAGGVGGGVTGVLVNKFFGGNHADSDSETGKDEKPEADTGPVAETVNDKILKTKKGLKLMKKDPRKKSD